MWLFAQCWRKAGENARADAGAGSKIRMETIDGGMVSHNNAAEMKDRSASMKGLEICQS